MIDRNPFVKQDPDNVSYHLVCRAVLFLLFWQSLIQFPSDPEFVNFWEYQAICYYVSYNGWIITYYTLYSITDSLWRGVGCCGWTTNFVNNHPPPPFFSHLASARRQWFLYFLFFFIYYLIFWLFNPHLKQPSMDLFLCSVFFIKFFLLLTGKQTECQLSKSRSLMR